MTNQMGEQNRCRTARFDRRLMLQFCASAGHLRCWAAPYRELDDALGLMRWLGRWSPMCAPGKNGRYTLVGLLWG
jgi:hypothetical protein